MRPVDFQPAILQTPSAERAQQQQQSQPQISQQAFAGEMNRLAEERIHQVRETGAGHETRPPEEMTEQKRENNRQGKRNRLQAVSKDAIPAEEKADIPDGTHIDVRI